MYMKQCTYKITSTGQTFDSYFDLLNYVKGLKEEVINTNDLVYSKIAKKEEQTKKLDKIKIENIKESIGVEQVGMNGEPLIEGKNHVLSFITSGEANINGHNIVTPFSKEDYINNEKEILKSQDGLSEQQADSIVKTKVSNWDKLSEDGLWLHKVVNSGVYIGTDQDNIQKNVDKINNIEGKSDRLSDDSVLRSLVQQLNDKYKKTIGSYNNRKTYRGFSIKAKLKETDKELFGKINWLTVGEDGSIHIYLFKITDTHPSKWSKAKRDTYLNQLAFIKQMLAYNGIDTSNTTMEIIPIQLKYNSDYSKITSIDVHESQRVSTRQSSTEYSMDKYDKYARYFISSNYVPTHISNEPDERAREVCRAIFPDLNLTEMGIDRSARQWVKNAPGSDPLGIEPLVITKVNDYDHTWEVIIDGKVIPIKDKTSNKNKNQEILKVVKEHLSELVSNKGYSIQVIKDALSNSMKRGFSTFSEVKGLQAIASKLDAIFNKYVLSYTEDEETKERTYEWEMLDTLTDNSIIIFKNKDNTIDVVSLTSFDINAKAEFTNGTNILGGYRTDSQFTYLSGTFGNIETVRAVEFLNESIGELKDSTLGNITVVSTLTGDSQTTHIGEFNRNYFQKILDEVNVENPKLKAKNNITGRSVTNPVDTLLQEYQRIIENRSRAVQISYESFGFDQVKDAQSKIEQIDALQNLLQNIVSVHYEFNDAKNVRREMTSGSNPMIKNLAILYELANKALLYLTDQPVTVKTEFSNINSKYMTPPTVSDDNLRLVATNLQIAHDSIAEEFYNEYHSIVRPQFNKFYTDCGYTNTKNMILSTQSRTYDNLYERDDLMTFKNPYDESNDLKDHERTILKHALFQIARINSNGNFQYSSPDDSRLPQYIKEHPWYLWVPLERASTATSRSSEKAWLAKLNNTFRKLKDFSNSFDEFVNGVTEEERQLYGDPEKFYQLRLRNPFEMSVPVSGVEVNRVRQKRYDMINKYGAEFFETNLENILIDFLAQQITTTKYQRFLVGTRALMLELYITGEFNGNQKVVDKEIEWIEEYIKVNIFNDTNMTKEEKKIVGVITPFRRITSHMLLAGNVVAAIRDSLQGAEQNFMRTLIGLGTDIDKETLLKAYKYVHKHSTVDAMAQNLLSQLNLRYRISNMDQARIKERAKTARNGLTNIENGLYFTLRGPDFLNRMTLFVARCMKDGVWEAFSLDSNGKLVYDWKKDARFKDYVERSPESIEYKKAKSLYLSYIRMYNKEHPDRPITPEQGLPTPYTNKEMNNIRGLADNIYGAYDKSKKAMAEHESQGFLFLNYFTWMNGMTNTYFMSAQSNETFGLELQQEKDEQGNLLYYDNDGNITTEQTDLPVYEKVPVQVVGILPMIGEAYRKMKSGKWKDAKDYLMSNDIYKARVNKLGTDFLMWAFWAMLFKMILSRLYQKNKKKMPDNPLFVNIPIELLYKGFSRSHDDYLGPFNLIQYFGENINPPYYSQPIELTKDIFSTLFGEKSVKYLMLDNTGFTRSFKDAISAYLKSKQ